jgi:hypothetical protein
MEDERNDRGQESAAGVDFNEGQGEKVAWRCGLEVGDS